MTITQNNELKDVTARGCQAALFTVSAKPAGEAFVMPGMTEAFAFIGLDIYAAATCRIDTWDAMIAQEQARSGLLGPGVWVWEGHVEGDRDDSGAVLVTEVVKLVGDVRRATVSDFDSFRVPLLADPIGPSGRFEPPHTLSPEI